MSDLERPVATMDVETGRLYIFALAPMFNLQYGVRMEYPRRDNEEVPQGTPCIGITLNSDEALEEGKELTAIAIEERAAES